MKLILYSIFGWIFLCILIHHKATEICISIWVQSLLLCLRLSIARNFVCFLIQNKSLGFLEFYLFWEYFWNNLKCVLRFWLLAWLLSSRRCVFFNLFSKIIKKKHWKFQTQCSSHFIYVWNIIQYYAEY